MVSTLENKRLHHNHHVQRRVVQGNFPIYTSKAELVLSKINKVLVVISIVTMALSMLIYSAVASKEANLNAINRQTKELNYKNLELRNKVNYLKSFYNIDKTITQKSTLAKAKSVIEIKAIDPNIKIDMSDNNQTPEIMMGY